MTKQVYKVTYYHNSIGESDKDAEKKSSGWDRCVSKTVGHFSIRFGEDAPIDVKRHVNLACVLTHLKI